MKMLICGFCVYKFYIFHNKYVSVYYIYFFLIFLQLRHNLMYLYMHHLFAHESKRFVVDKYDALNDISCDRVFTCWYDVRHGKEKSCPYGEAGLVPRRMKFRQVRHHHRQRAAYTVNYRCARVTSYRA